MADINKNRNYLKDSLNLIMDTETRTVLASAPSLSTANTLMMFYPNLGVMRLPTQLHSTARRFIDYDFNDLSQTYVALEALTGRLQKANDSLVTEDLIKLRSEIILRTNFIYTLECVCLNEIGQVIDYAGMPLLMPWLIDQLNRCQPESGVYTNSIQELASYRDIPVDNCYQEFRMKIDSIGIMMSKNYVIFLKYAEKMSREEADNDKLLKIFKAAEDELRFNSLI